MSEVKISEEILRRVRAFQKVIDVILGEKLPKESDYVDLILSIGLDRMLQDPLPEEEMLLKTMVDMFHQNPEFVSDFIAETLKRGALIEKGKEEDIKRNWGLYIV